MLPCVVETTTEPAVGGGTCSTRREIVHATSPTPTTVTSARPSAAARSPVIGSRAMLKNVMNGSSP